MTEIKRELETLVLHPLEHRPKREKTLLLLLLQQFEQHSFASADSSTSFRPLSHHNTNKLL